MESEVWRVGSEVAFAEVAGLRPSTAEEDVEKTVRSNASSEINLQTRSLGWHVFRKQSCTRNPRRRAYLRVPPPSDGSLSRFRNPSNRIHQTPQN